MTREEVLEFLLIESLTIAGVYQHTIIHRSGTVKSSREKAKILMKADGHCAMLRSGIQIAIDEVIRKNADGN